MKALEKLFAEKLLKVKAVKIQPANPFTWASGWKSPIYCDNRKTLSYPALRNFVKLEICRVILEKFGEVDAIAGVATGAIAQGALVAEELNLPFVYVRSSPKDHGLENLIEGELRPGMKVVVVEDFSFEAPKTKDLKVKLDACGLKNCLFIDGKEVDVNFALASRNIAGVDVLPTIGANVYDILRKDKLVLTKDAVSCLEERLK